MTTRHQWPRTKSTIDFKKTTAAAATAPLPTSWPEMTTADTYSNDSATLQYLDIKGYILFVQGHQVKTLNLKNGSVQSGPEFPSDSKGYSGDLVGEDLVICGGITSTYNLTNDCHVLSLNEPNQFRKTHGLLEPRAEAASIALNDSVLFISGGLGSNSTEFWGQNVSEFGPQFPVNLDNHCMIKRNEDNILITGKLSLNIHFFLKK